MKLPIKPERIMISIIILPTIILQSTDAIFCYKCESYRDYRCLDPFDIRPHIQVNCDMEPFVRDKKPVFCEKVTELLDGVYVTTRGCSQYQWEDVAHILDHRNQHMQCTRRGFVERCLCTNNSCNSALSISNPQPSSLFKAFQKFAPTFFIVILCMQSIHIS